VASPQSRSNAQLLRSVAVDQRSDGPDPKS
jgi:hypothetical protein